MTDELLACCLCGTEAQRSEGVMLNADKFVCNICCEKLDDGDVKPIKQGELHCVIHNGGFLASELTGYQLDSAAVCDHCKEEALEQLGLMIAASGSSQDDSE